MTRQEELEGIVRESGSLVERLESCRARIAAMCKEGRPPKMTIPVQWNDDDFFISVTLQDAQQCVQRMGLTEGEILRYWQHDETGYLCATAHRPSDRWHEITQEQYESDPRVSKLSTPHR